LKKLFGNPMNSPVFSYVRNLQNIHAELHWLESSMAECLGKSWKMPTMREILQSWSISTRNAEVSTGVDLIREI